MKNWYRTLGFLLFATIAILGCDADVEIDQTVEQIKSEQPTIVSVSPTSAAVNTEVEIAGTFLNFADRAFIGDVEAQITSRITGEKLIIQVPNNALSGVVTIVTEQEKEAVSSDILAVTYPAPSVTGSLPAEGDVNSLINIIGTNLVSITGVTFGGVDGTIEFQEDQALVVRIPNNVGIVDIEITYLTSGGSTSQVIATGFEIILPQPTLGGFPAVMTRDNEVIVTGQDMNLITAGDVNGAALTFNSLTPTEVRFNIPSSVNTGYVDVNLNFQGGGTITQSQIPYINGQFEQLYEFDSDPASVFVVDYTKDPLAVTAINGNVPQPPFPGNQYYSLEMNTATGSTVARAKFNETSTNPAAANVLDNGNFNNNPVMHFWMHTEGTNPTFKIYIGGSSSSDRRQLDTYTEPNIDLSEWNLYAVRLNGFIPNGADTSSDFDLRLTPGSSSSDVPEYFNLDWIIVTDRVLTEFGAIDMTDEFDPI